MLHYNSKCLSTIFSNVITHTAGLVVHKTISSGYLKVEEVSRLVVADFTCQLPSDAALVLTTNDCNVASLFSSICSRCNASYTTMQTASVSSVNASNWRHGRVLHKQTLNGLQ